MRIRQAFARRLGALVCALLGALLGAVPVRAEAPLTAIDWLGEAGPVIRAPEGGPMAEQEAPVSLSASAPDVTIASIGAARAQVSVGLLGRSITGLPETLWSGSRYERLREEIAGADFRSIAALQRLFYTLMLAEALPPDGADAERFLTLRADRLRAFGAIEPAEALVERLPLSSAAHFGLWFDLTLLAGLEDKACAVLNAKRGLSGDYAAHIFCAVRGENWADAALLFEAADALGLLSGSQRQLLLAFLDPDYAEASPFLAPPREISPLEFRLYDAVGNPLPTANLPVAFAVSDLRAVAGWKAQLEAAERLVRNGALSSNVLLGLYTERKPSASGGVWERARAVQGLEAALEEGGAARLSAALLRAHEVLAAHGLVSLLADLYAPEIVGAELTHEAEDLRFRLGLLSADYERAEVPRDPAADVAFLQSLAAGAPLGAAALEDRLAEAIEAGFGAALPDPAVLALMEAGQLGQAILAASEQLKAGLSGDLAALRSGLAALRLMGLEDVARRASLDMMLQRRQF